jgi:hypothetical protein
MRAELAAMGRTGGPLVEAAPVAGAGGQEGPSIGISGGASATTAANELAGGTECVAGDNNDEGDERGDEEVDE